MKLLLVEDQKHMAYAIEEYFKKDKFLIDLAFDGEFALDLIEDNIYDVIILDIMLPKVDGLTVLKTLRNNDNKTPVIMLSARSEVEDKVKGLDYGADDYLAKPFMMVELSARIKALTRRKGSIEDNIFRFNDISYNVDELKLECNDRIFTLTLKESELLKMFLERPNKVVAKETIINKIWSYDKIVIDNNVEVYISFLRKKLLSLNSIVKIVTVRGIGYKMVGDNNV